MKIYWIIGTLLAITSLIVAGRIAGSTPPLPEPPKPKPNRDVDLPSGPVPKQAGPAGIEWIYSAPANVFFAKTETTVAQYRECVKIGICPETKNASQSKYCNWGSNREDTNPINCVDFLQAKAFCIFAHGRLPRDDEWIAEASNEGIRKYPWGDEKPSCEFTVMDDHGKGCGRVSTWPVCSKPSGNSVSGLCDMSGNVSEWTSYLDQPSRDGGGGAWAVDDPAMFSSSFRSRNIPTGSGSNFGLRCVRPFRLPDRSARPSEGGE